LAVELNGQLAESLSRAFPGAHAYRRDFLECNGDLGKSDRIVMNPPFDHGADTKHVEHALEMLADGGRLVSQSSSVPATVTRA
jgi:16S rRNA G1207 methylase RsmC